VDVAEMVLCGQDSKEISSTVVPVDEPLFSGRDDSLLQCTKQITKDGIDLGFVGLG
jgi:acetylglutamate kinase